MTIPEKETSIVLLSDELINRVELVVKTGVHKRIAQDGNKKQKAIRSMFEFFQHHTVRKIYASAAEKVGHDNIKQSKRTN